MYMYYVKTNNEKRVTKFEKEGGVWREEREKVNDATILYPQNLREIIKKITQRSQVTEFLNISFT